MTREEQNSIIKKVLTIAKKAKGSNNKKVEKEIVNLLEREVPQHILKSGRTKPAPRRRRR